MSYLKSREGDSGGRKLLGKRIIEETIGEESITDSFPFGASLKPCSAEKLLPPMQLMTRERSFRHLYRKYHPPVQICKMDFLQRKEDPVVKKKREEIYARIRAGELASSRLKREKKAWESNRNDRMNGGEAISIANSSSEHSSNEDSQDGSSIDTNSKRKEQVAFVNGIVSGFVAENKKADIQSSTASNNSYYDDLNEDDYGGNFSFLADWKKETEKSPMKHKRSKIK